MSIRKRWRLARAWFRAFRLGFGWGPCPLCRRPFSCEEVIDLPHPESLLHRSHANAHVGFMIVCGSPRCQEAARQLNARQFGYSRLLGFDRLDTARRYRRRDEHPFNGSVDE